MKTKYIFATLFLITLFSQSFATSYTWTGNAGTSWNTSGSWSPSGVPDSTSNVTIVSATNAPVLDQNRKVSLFTMTSGTLDLNSYTLTTTVNSTFTSGTISNGVVKPTGSLCHFGGTTFSAKVKASCAYFHLNGGTFNNPVELISAGTSSTSGTGGCVFNDSLTIAHGGTLYYTMGSSGKDIFNGPVTITNTGTHEIYLATGDSAFFNNNLILNSTNNGGINFGNSGGVSTLASGKTISIGTTGFTNDYLTLKNFIQAGSTSQTLTLTGTAIVNMVNCTFNGDLTVTSPGFLIKDNTFNGTATLTRNGSTTNHQSDGGNTFNGAVTINNAGSGGRIRLSTTTPDIYYGTTTFNTTGGQDVQLCYTGNSYFYGDITINSNKVVFNTASGKVTLAGGNSQSLNGSYNFPFKQLAIDKSAGFVKVNATCSVDDSLFLVKGYFLTNSTNLITLKAGAKVTGASKNSYIDGPVKKIGNTAFVFPTGKNNSYRPIEMSAPSTTTSEFTGEFLEDSVLAHTTQRDSSLGYLIRNKYWKLNRNAGSSQVYITLAWDSLNALVDTFVNVASWNGSQWKNLGKCPIVGTSVVGSIKSASSASAYYEFSLGYGSLSTIPFPPNCQSIESESDLRFCLSHASGEINVTADFFIDAIGQNDPAMSHFPIFVPSYIILNGLPGSNSPKWWEAGCPVISTNFTAEYHVNNSAFPVRNVYLFEMATGATIQNLRIRGASCDVKEYNDAAILCGGVYIMEEIGQSIATISNCEISCFSQAGVWKSSHPEILNLINCYVHKVRGKTESGIGYGVWSMGDLTPTPTVNFNNCIFDDCKAAIDGQGYPINWNILHCSLSQFFQSEDIHMHNYNEFHSQYVDNNTNFHSDCHIKYPCSISLNNSFNGLASDLSTSIEPVCTNTIVSSYSKKIDPCIVYNDNMTYIPMYDIGGADITVQNTIFHKNWKLGTNGNLSLKFPNRDTGHNGVADNKIDIQFNTFSTFRFTPTEAWYCSTNPINYNNTGYAKISDNYIDASVWSADPYNIVGDNYFDYKRGDNVAATAPLAPQPCELTIDLKTGTTSLNESYTKTPYSGKKYIQYAQVGDPIKIDVDLSNATGATSKFFIIRPNASENAPVGNFESHVVSNQNYFYNDEIYTQASTSPTSTFNQPGLYGIDVMGFDVASTSGNYEFKASAWEHIPVIIVPVDQQMLYFNIKDSYRKDGAATGVKKQAYLNELLIWEEDIAAGGTGWELVEVDLKDFAPNTTTEIISVLHTDGSPNVLSFSIYLETGISTNEVAGVFVWVDDVYIPKTSSLNGDNLIKDGTMELSDNELCLSCNWFQNETGASTTLGCGTTDVGINSLDRKSGSNAIYLKVPYGENCTYNNNQGEIVASVGTNIDFTDLLSCDNYWTPDVTPIVPNGGHSKVGFEPFPGTLNVTYTKEKFWIGNTIVIDNGETLTFVGCELAISPGFEIIVNDGGILTITFDNTNSVITPSHLFSCDEMWQGITVKPGGKLTIEGEKTMDDNRYCRLENALVAIKGEGDGSTNSDEPEIYVNQVIFNSNMISIELLDDDFATTDIMQCLFECDGEILTKAPHVGDYPQNHILLENALNVEIGSGGNQNNVFKDDYSGILVLSSSLTLRKGEFINLKDHNSLIPAKGVGIIAFNNTNTAYDLDVDSRFNNLSRGIFSRGNFNINIHDLDYFKNIDDVAIALFHFNYANDIVVHNVGYFENTNIGVVISGRNLNSVIISNNTFTNTNFVETSTGAFHNTALTLRGVSSTGGTVEVYRNTITDYRNGIHAMNLNNIRIGGNDGSMTSYNNDIIYNLTASLSEVHHGIWLQNCDDADILENTIINIDPTTETNLRGIVVENSDNANIGCNEINNMGRAMQFEGFCLGNPGTQLLNNEMTDFEVGIQMETAQLSTQGTAGEPWDNEWINYVNNSASHNKVDGQLIQPTPITWYFQGTDGDDADPLVPSPRGAGIIDDEDGQPDGTLACANANRIGSFDRDMVFGPIVGDSATFDDYEEELQYAFKNYLYELLKQNDLLLTLGLPTDSSFQRFYSEMDTTNIGSFGAIRLAIDSNMVDSAATLNELVTDRNSIESSRKSVNTVIINKILQGLVPDAADTTLLEYIFTQHWIIAGKAVYEAAAILGKEYHSPEISFRKSSEQVVETKKPEEVKLKFNIYPNPATNTVKISSPESTKFVFELRDIYNRICVQKENIKDLDVSTFSNGIYAVRILVSDKVQYSGKLVIIK